VGGDERPTEKRRAKSMTREERVVESLVKRFPKVWAKPGSDFRQGAIVWSGEGSEMPNGLPAFDYYSESSLYEFGVHKKLVEWAAKRGMYWECYDPGTFLAYKG
jgi:hypothetical protein